MTNPYNLDCVSLVYCYDQGDRRQGVLRRDPMHPNLIQMYGIARIKRSAKRMGVQQEEMTEEETQR